MGELTYKARRLESKIAGNVQQAAVKATKHWHVQNEGCAQERNGPRRAFLGKVVNTAANKT